MQINFSDGSEELLDDIFDTEEEARDEYRTWLENWGAGRETLRLAGEDFVDADIEDYIIWDDDE